MAEGDKNIENEVPRKGVKTKIIGVIMMLLGGLNSMLLWKGGMPVSASFLFIFVAGVFLYVIGTIRGSGPDNEDGA